MLLIKLIGENRNKCDYDAWFCLSPIIPSFFFSISAKLTKAYQTAAILFEVLKAVNLTHAMKVDDEVIIAYFLLVSLPPMHSIISILSFVNIFRMP